MVFDDLGYLARRAGRGIADSAVTMPLVRWTWSSLADEKFAQSLVEFRPIDAESVRDMMAGRYVFASRLVDTGGVSPFSIDVDNIDWREEAQSFAWLRHFREARDEGQRRFARTLVLDWIGRHGRYSAETWAPSLMAQRVLNWLRHYPLIVEGAGAEEERLIARTLATQVQSLKMRRRFSTAPVEALLTALALTGVALCNDREGRDLERRLTLLEQMIGDQYDASGLHLSRNARVQLMLLVELVSIRQTLPRISSAYAARMGALVEPMHQALSALTLASGEPAYFNGTGQLPHDILVSVQAQSTTERSRSNRLLGGYGILAEGEAVVVADSGLVPPPGFGGEAHAGALGVEFSHGTELIFGSCGPAPAELPESRLLFRQGIAHSSATIDGQSASMIAERGRFAGEVLQRGEDPEISIDGEDASLIMLCHGFDERFGVRLERRVTLLAGGRTLVGQDRVAAAGMDPVSGVVTVRFHLAPGAQTVIEPGGGMVRVRLPSGAVWSFLWEGAELREDESVRQSAHFGFHRTRQLMLEANAAPGAEIAWVFTLEQAAGAG